LTPRYSRRQSFLARALEHGSKLHGDPAVVANGLEEVAAVVSNVIDNMGTAREGRFSIDNQFVRGVNRLKRKQFIVARPNGEVRRPSPGWY
jgi:hypothetical protein